MASISYVAILLAVSLFLTLNISTATKETRKKEIRLHFYVQERTKFPNANIIKVVSSPIDKSENELTFGDMFVFDDDITEDHDPKSRLLGRVQGILPITSFNGSAGLFTINLAFTDLYPWTGSSLSIIGSFSFKNETKEFQELQVVGGTGRFRFAKGYVVLRRVSSSNVNIRTFELGLVLFTI